MTKPFRCLVVDDEPLAIDVIENYLERFANTETLRAENAMDAFSILKGEQIDLMFLDIEMPLLNGLDFLKSLKNPPPVIITTAYRNYAVESFEFEVLDYLVKPIAFPRFVKAYERALKWQTAGEKTDPARSAEEPGYLFLKVDRKLIKIIISEIWHIESLKDYVRLTTLSGSFISYQSLTSLTEKLPPDRFLRIHRSYTIALDKVSAVENNCVVIHGKSIPISREHRQEVLKKLSR